VLYCLNVSVLRVNTRNVFILTRSYQPSNVNETKQEARDKNFTSAALHSSFSSYTYTVIYQIKQNQEDNGDGISLT